MKIVCFSWKVLRKGKLATFHFVLKVLWHFILFKLETCRDIYEHLELWNLSMRVFISLRRRSIINKRWSKKSRFRFANIGVSMTKRIGSPIIQIKITLSFTKGLFMPRKLMTIFHFRYNQWQLRKGKGWYLW